MKSKDLTKLILFISTCTYLLFLALIVELKKPLCIDSQVVNKIDINRIHVMSCHQNEVRTYKVSYEPEVEKMILSIQFRLQKIELYLNSLAPFKNGVRIAVDTKDKFQFFVDKNQILIGEGLLRLDSQLQRALVKVWVLQYQRQLQIDTQLFTETLTDFIFYTAFGHLNFENPIYNVKTKIGFVQWPQIIKSLDNYCRSAWIYPESLQGCFDKTISTSIKPETLSLRPLLVSAWIESYQELAYKEQQSLIKRLPLAVNQLFLNSEEAIQSILKTSDPIHSGLQNIIKFNELVSSIKGSNTQSEMYKLYTGINTKLQSYGVTNSYAEALFDYVIEFEGQVNPASPLFKSVETAALKQKNIQIAIIDKNSVWIMPSQTALPLKVFDKIQARTQMNIGCLATRPIAIEKYFDKVDKLILVNHCQTDQSFKFEPLFEKGFNQFYTVNTQLKFIQFHLPSLKMIKEEISLQQNFFDLVKSRNLEQKDFKALGWSQLEWKNDLKAYKPKAVVDAIEYFRN